MSLDDVKRDVAIANRILAATGLAAGLTLWLGHASLRVPDQPDRFVVKGRGYAMDALARMKPEDMVVVDLDGYKVGGPDGVSQCYEVKMHSCIYRTYPDVKSIVHVHPKYTILMGLLHAPIKPLSNSGAQLVRHGVPVYPHAKLILTDEDGMGVAETLGSAKAVILEGHGAATTGSSLQESVLNMLYLEEQCLMNWYAYSAVGPEYGFMSAEMLDEALAMPRYEDLPHFKDSYQADRERPFGTWAYYTDLVSKDL